MTIAFQAMLFARERHAAQRRKYTGNPYFDHLAEVAGIAMSVGWSQAEAHPDTFMATAWLHDVREDQGVSHVELLARFGPLVADGVAYLSDLEVGNRATRKAASRTRLAAAPAWVQTIKVADLISNTSSIVEHDPDFARVYLSEKRALLEVLTRANPMLKEVAERETSRL